MDFYSELMHRRNEENRFARYLGITTTEIREGFAAGELAVREEYGNMLNSVHGGCIFTLADTIGGAAASSHGNRITTISSDFHYLSPALETDKLFAAAREIKYGKRISVYDVEVSDEHGKLIAKGIFSYCNLS